MPYKVVNKCVHKLNSDNSVGDVVPGGCHKTDEEAQRHARALYANVKDSSVAEFSMVITKARFNPNEVNPNRRMQWRSVNSDVDSDLYDEKMSRDLFYDFTHRINDNIPVPEPFEEVICEGDWCGGMPYLSIAHYKAGTGLTNVPGIIDSVYVEGEKLKSRGFLDDSPLGKAVYESLKDDIVQQKSNNAEHKPVRISIGFLDLEHKHIPSSVGQEYTFTRTSTGQICPLCAQGIGGKIYMKGQLVHLAMTRVPVNPRTSMNVERSMDEIETKHDDAKSIIGDLAEALEEKSIASDVLVVRSDESGALPQPDPSPIAHCYDPNDGGWNQECINSTMAKWMVDQRNEIGTTVKSMIKDVVAEVIEEARRKDVSDADKKRAEKEYGDVKYADEANKKYPIDTDEHIRAALSYWGMPKNRSKYSSEEQKKIGGRIRAAAKSHGINVEEKSFVEDAMATDNVEKMQLGGENVDHKTFTYTQDGVTIHGDGNNTIPNPVKADTEDEDKKDKGADEEMEKSDVDKAYETLKSQILAKDVAGINQAFQNLGTAVEKEFAPPVAETNPNDLAAIVKSAVEAAVAPLKIQIATLQAGQQGNAVSTGNVAKSKALNLNPSGIRPEDLIAKSQGQNATPAPYQKLSQIQQIARRSTGLNS